MERIKVIRIFLGAALAALCASCNMDEMWGVFQEPEPVVTAPQLTPSYSLVGNNIAEFKCKIDSTDRVYKEGLFIYGLSTDESKWKTVSSSIAQNELRAYADDIIRDTTYYFRAIVTDKFGSDTSSVCSFKSPVFDVLTGDFHVGYKGDVVTVSVSSDFGFELSFPDADWLREKPSTKAPSETSRTIEVDVNTDFFARQATICVTAPDGCFHYSYTLVQDPSPLLCKDEVFMAYLLKNYDTDADGELYYDEFTAIKKIDMVGYEVSDVSEIRHMPLLETIRIIPEYGYKGMLKSIDISNNHKLRNLNVKNNKIEEIQIEGCPEVVSVDVSCNLISRLDLTKCPLLDSLVAYSNQIQELDMTFCPQIKYVECRNNKLSSLKLGVSQNLYYVNAENNLLTDLNVSVNSALKFLNFSDNQISDIKLVNNKLLQDLSLNNNKLSNLNLRSNRALKTLSCYGNTLETLSIENNNALTSVDCHGTGISELVIEKNLDLEYLNCGGNNITLLDISKNVKLKDLYCNCPNMGRIYLDSSISIEGITYNRSDDHINPATEVFLYDQSFEIADKTLKDYLLRYYDFDSNGEVSYFEAEKITSINVSGLPVKTLSGIENLKMLKSLKCSGCQLDTIDISSSVLLEDLFCENNGLKEIVLTGAVSLKRLWCQNNELTSLDLSSNVNLLDLDCQCNRITELDLSANTLLEALDCSPMNDPDGKNYLQTVWLSTQVINYVNAPDYPRNIGNIPYQTALMYK